jgi:hypothetical protein
MTPSANTDSHAKQGSPGVAAFDDTLISLWKEAVLNKTAAAKRHLPGLGGDANNDRPAKNAAVRSHVTLDRPARNAD